MFCLCRSKGKIILGVVSFLFLITVVSGEDELIIRKNAACEKEQESEFPKDLFTPAQRKFGAILLHVILFIYSFGAIAVVCAEHFLPTITCICEDLKLSDDVAAATFMSIATSSPELFSNIIGTFITESDIGLGHVIGNAYFDMFFVAALGGLVAKHDIILEWWPLARDCSIYFIVTLTLTGIVWDGVIQTHETIILLLLYVAYFFIMFNNQKIIQIFSEKFKIQINNTTGSHVQTMANNLSDAITVSTEKSEHKAEKTEKGDIEETQPLGSDQDIALPPPIIQLPPPPVENKCWNIAKKIFTVPLALMVRYTIPDVRIPGMRKYYPMAFVLCVAWIAVSTYLGTWMISVIGDTIAVPDLIMGMVFMAAGGSVVEAYSVYYKAKRGECSIGLSNSMGCNNLDATMCLALPWFIKTLLPVGTSVCGRGTSNIILGSSLLRVNCILLVISVVILFNILYFNKFTLNRRLGIICGTLYVLVLIIAISIENNSTSKK